MEKIQGRPHGSGAGGLEICLLFADSIFIVFIAADIFCGRHKWLTPNRKNT